MSFTTPWTAVAGTVVTAANWNTYIRDNQRYLKGIGQVPTIESGLTIDNTDGDERLLLPLLTTAECATTLNAEGEVAHDEQTHRVKVHNGSGLYSIVSTADVDDTPADGATTDPISSNWAYDFTNTLTTAGDITFATAARTWDRLAIGTALQLLRTNAGTTAPEWATVAGIQIVSSNYAGNNGNDRQITTGFVCKAVFVTDLTAYQWLCISASGTTKWTTAPAMSFVSDVVLHATDGFAVDAAHANATGTTYYYVAIG
uniref:Tail protein n=2 Tax=viral metagenome TaxID=1070528 RepID=A0A6M3IXQ3_9ZZZZ